MVSWRTVRCSERARAHTLSRGCVSSDHLSHRHCGHWLVLVLVVASHTFGYSSSLCTVCRLLFIPSPFYTWTKGDESVCVCVCVEFSSLKYQGNSIRMCRCRHRRRRRSCIRERETRIWHAGRVVAVLRRRRRRWQTLLVATSTSTYPIKAYHHSSVCSKLVLNTI